MMKKLMIFFLIFSHSAIVHTMEPENPLMPYTTEGAYKLLAVVETSSRLFSPRTPRIEVVLGKAECLPVKNSSLVSCHLSLKLSCRVTKDQISIPIEEMTKCVFCSDGNIVFPDNSFHIYVENCNDSKDMREIFVERLITPIVTIYLEEPSPLPKSDENILEKNPIVTITNQNKTEEIVAESTKKFSMSAKLTGSVLLAASTLFVLYRMNYLPSSISSFLSNMQGKLFGI